MKKFNTPIVLQKVRNRFNETEIFYTYKHWELNSIDGVVFIPVLKKVEDSSDFYKVRKNIRYVRKDSYEVF
jgi:hypothetical protein